MVNYTYTNVQQHNLASLVASHICSQQCEQARTKVFATCVFAYCCCDADQVDEAKQRLLALQHSSAIISCDADATPDTASLLPSVRQRLQQQHQQQLEMGMEEARLLATATSSTKLELQHCVGLWEYRRLAGQLSAARNVLTQRQGAYAAQGLRLQEEAGALRDEGAAELRRSDAAGVGAAAAVVVGGAHVYDAVAARFESSRCVTFLSARFSDTVITIHSDAYRRALYSQPLRYLTSSPRRRISCLFLLAD